MLIMAIVSVAQTVPGPGGRGDHRAEQQAELGVQHTGSDGHAQQVVYKSEEKILSDVLH